MDTQSKITIHFAGMDYFCRAVFRAVDTGHYYKSLELMADHDFASLSDDEKETLLHSLCDTDEMEGEPGWLILRDRFMLME